MKRIRQEVCHRFAMREFVRRVPGVSAAPQPPANGWQPSGLRLSARCSQVVTQAALQLETRNPKLFQ